MLKFAKTSGLGFQVGLPDFEPFLAVNASGDWDSEWGYVRASLWVKVFSLGFVIDYANRFRDFDRFAYVKARAFIPYGWDVNFHFWKVMGEIVCQPWNLEKQGFLGGKL